MKELYGRHSGMIAGVLGLLNAVLLVSMELRVLGIFCESLLNAPAMWETIGRGIILAVYAAHGGIKSVTATDIFQFIMLAIFIPPHILEKIHEIYSYIQNGNIKHIKSYVVKSLLNKLKMHDETPSATTY